MRSDTANTAPDLVSLQRSLLVHKVTGRLGQEKHADTHDRGEHERAAENIAPGSVHGDEHGCYGVTKDFSEGDVELVEGNEVTTESALYGFGDIHGDGTTFETDSSAEDNAGCNDHTIVHAAGGECTADGVEDTGDDDSPAATKVLVTGRDEKSTSNSYAVLANVCCNVKIAMLTSERHAGVDQGVLLC